MKIIVIAYYNRCLKQSCETHRIGEAEEYRCLRGVARGAGDAGLEEAGWLRAGRGDAGAELLSRSAAALFRLPERDASNRNASCSREPVHIGYVLALPADGSVPFKSVASVFESKCRAMLHYE